MQSEERNKQAQELGTASLTALGQGQLQERIERELTYQHVKTCFIRKTCDERGDERIPRNSSKRVSLVSHVLDLLQLDDCERACSALESHLTVARWNKPSTFRNTFNANTLLRSSGLGFAKRASQTRANVPGGRL